jgi:hypothetical protein
MSKCEIGEHLRFINLISLANIHYISSKVVRKEQSISNIKTLLSFINITTANTEIDKKALHSSFNDIDGALQYFSATTIDNVSAIITRDINDFKQSEIPVYTPSEFLKLNF